MRAILFALGYFAFCASAATPRFHIEAELELPRIYVGGETILRVRLLRAAGVPYGVLRPPALGDAAEDLVELLLRHDERIVLSGDLTSGLVVVERHAVRGLDHEERRVTRRGR